MTPALLCAAPFLELRLAPLNTESIINRTVLVAFRPSNTGKRLFEVVPDSTSRIPA
jgi:hypothetical protein